MHPSSNSLVRLILLVVLMIGLMRGASAFSSSSYCRGKTVRPFSSTTRVLYRNRTPASLDNFQLNAGFGLGGLTAKKKALKILKYPHPKLRADNEPISEFNEELKEIVDGMLETMYDDDGIGLAAPQVGINKQLMVFNQDGDPETPEMEMVLCNPRIVSHSEETKLGEEGCLSFPQISGEVARNTWVEVEYQNIKGDTLNIKFEGKPAIIFQHEFDHLNKVLFIDRLVEMDKELNQKRLDKYVKKYGAGAAP